MLSLLKLSKLVREKLKLRNDEPIKAKIWKRDEAEPADWTVQATDPIGHTKGSPGIYGYSAADVYYDNLSVTPAN